jgi:hypothetical protein
LQTRRECHQSSNGVTRARPLKNKAERVKEVVLRHVRLADMKALSGTFDKRQSHVFSQGLLLKYRETDYFYWLQTCPVILRDGVFNFGFKTVGFS